MDLLNGSGGDFGEIRECVGDSCSVVAPESSPSLPSNTPFEKVTIPFGSDWKYWDHPDPPHEDWQVEGFDDSQWLSSHAPLGYCFREEGTHIRIASTIDPRPAYFRHEFELQKEPRDTGRIRLAIHRHGRIVVWLNGREVVRDNAPKSPANDADCSWTPSKTEEFPLQFSLNIRYLHLIRGKNLLAVEMRPCYRAICFDLALSLDDLNVARQPTYLDRPTDLLGEGNALPNLVWTDLLTNQIRSTRDLLGQKFILDIMGAQCGPCWEAMPKLERWAAHLRNQRVAVVVVCSDGTSKDMQNRLSAQVGSFPSLSLGVEPFGGDMFATVAYRRLGVESVPSMFLVDEQGFIRGCGVGSSGPDYDHFVHQVKSAGIRLPS